MVLILAFTAVSEASTLEEDVERLLELVLIVPRAASTLDEEVLRF